MKTIKIPKKNAVQNKYILLSFSRNQTDPLKLTPERIEHEVVF